MTAARALALEPTVTDVWLAAREQFDSIINHLRAPQAQQMTHSELEQLLESEGCELLRRLLQGHLDERAPGAVSEPVRGSDGQVRPHEREHRRQLETIFGTVTVTRQGYGGHSLASLHPLDASLNLPPERYSHQVRRHAAIEVSKNSFDEVVAALENTTGASVAKRQVEELVVRAAQDFDAFYQQQSGTEAQTADSGAVLVISVDQKGVRMRPEDLRSVTKAALAERQPKLKHRLSPGEKSHTKRMATVATVYTIAPWVRTPAEIVDELARAEVALTRPRPEAKRVWASLEQPPEEVICQAFEEALRRDPEQRKQWVALVDGNETQLALLEVTAAAVEVEVTIILDLIHVLEYLWPAAWVFHRAGDPAAEAWVSERLEQLLQGRSSQVAAGLRRSATLRALKVSERAAVDRCADYLLKYRDYLHYDRYLGAGYPIASGVIEGACRHLVQDRLGLTGARWRIKRAEAVLRLRALRSSGDFEQYWQFHLEQEFKRNHQTHYANGEVPQLQSQSAAQRKGKPLRLVK